MSRKLADKADTVNTRKAGAKRRERNSGGRADADFLRNRL